MRFISLSILLLVWLNCSVVIHAQHENGKDIQYTQGDAAMQKDSLQLTTSVADHRICANDSLQMTLRLHYTNVGKQSIILYKYSSSIPRVLVSRDVRSAAKKKYEYEDHRYLVVTNLMLKPVDEPAPSESLFVILNPGDSYEIETPVSFIGSLRTGDQVLQVKVWTWYDESQDLIMRLREKWQQFGYLWSKTVTSFPMPFTIVKCH